MKVNKMTMKTTDKLMINIIIVTLAIILAIILPSLSEPRLVPKNYLHYLGVIFLFSSTFLGYLWVLSSMERIKTKLSTNNIIMISTLICVVAFECMGWYLFNNY